MAQLAWFLVPLRGAGQERAAGFPDGAGCRDRLTVLCTRLAVEPADVLTALVALQDRAMARIRTYGGQGVEPWASFNRRGDIAEIVAEQRWLAENRDRLLA